ncbi:MAG: response regulator [Deinococcales bacterium]
MKQIIEKKTILAADDQSGQRLILDMLLSSDYDLTLANDGRQVLEHLKTHTPDLIILDIEMPVINGLEICDRIKKVKRLQHVPVIILTAADDERSQTLAKISKADAYITKPLTGKNFSSTVQEMLSRPRNATASEA